VKDDRVYLQHIRDALNDIATYYGSDHGEFIANRMRQDATLRKLEVIGQAVKNLSEHTKSRQPEIPWRQIAGMRDKVIHDYFGGESRDRMGCCPERAAEAQSGDCRNSGATVSSICRAEYQARLRF
jgi:uncharacterized protein with HEPN domain